MHNKWAAKHGSKDQHATPAPGQLATTQGAAAIGDAFVKQQYTTLTLWSHVCDRPQGCGAAVGSAVKQPRAHTKVAHLGNLQSAVPGMMGAALNKVSRSGGQNPTHAHEEGLAKLRIAPLQPSVWSQVQELWLRHTVKAT
jgi:hypothetical protein